MTEFVALPGAAWSAASLADDIRTISRTISASYPADLDPEAHLWRRCMKVTEEAGEVFEALSGWLGENPRKGVTHNRADLRDELLDVAGAALSAASHLYGDSADPIDMLAGRLAFVRKRLLEASNLPAEESTTEALTCDFCGYQGPRNAEYDCGSCGARAFHPAPHNLPDQSIDWEAEARAASGVDEPPWTGDEVPGPADLGAC